MPASELATNPLFGGLSEQAIARVEAATAEVTAAPGQTLALPGDIGSGMFVLLEGSVTVELPGGGEVEVAAPGFVGELALLLPDTGRIGRVRAKTDVRCRSLSRSDFDELVMTEPSFALALLRGLATRLAASRPAG